MNEADPELFELIEARRDLAKALLDGFKSKAFDRPHTPEDVARCEREVAECEALLEELRKA